MQHHKPMECCINLGIFHLMNCQRLYVGVGWAVKYEGGTPYHSIHEINNLNENGKMALSVFTLPQYTAGRLAAQLA